jgi:hypothetical protein
MTTTHKSMLKGAVKFQMLLSFVVSFTTPDMDAV